MKLLSLLRVNEYDNVFFVCKKILHKYHVEFSDLKLKMLLDDHDEHTSLLAIKDILLEYGIESVALKKGDYSYQEFETPFICAIQQEGWPIMRFTVVWDVGEDKICYLEPGVNRDRTISLLEFEQIDKDIILLTDATNKKNEAKFKENIRQQFNRKIAREIPFYLIFLTAILSLGYYIFNYQNGVSWVNISYILTSLVGLIVSLILVLREVDIHNPLVRQICGLNSKKVNCNAVLDSPQSSFLGISWTIYGISFMGILFTLQVLFLGSLSHIYLSVLLSLLVFPYIFFSLYYQSSVIKQWCPLCLAVQSILLINAFIACLFIYSHGPHFNYISVHSIILSLIFALVFVATAYLLIPVLKEAKEGRIINRRWKKLHNNPAIFETLLSRSKRVLAPIDNLGILVGNPNAKNELVKVCHPYCGPCSLAHSELMDMLKDNENIRLRIIFTSSGEEYDSSTAPVRHFLGIHEKYGGHFVHQALNDWYLSKDKNYKSFALRYPMNGELMNQSHKIEQMYNWCQSMKIKGTPTFFINGYELPEHYTISELNNFF